MTFQINFYELEGPIYTGRARGEALRKIYELDSYDNQAECIEVIIPERTYSMTSSFFLGMFGPSIIAAGTPQAFFDKYHFTAAPELKVAFQDYAWRALEVNKFSL